MHKCRKVPHTQRCSAWKGKGAVCTKVKCVQRCKVHNGAVHTQRHSMHKGAAHAQRCSAACTKIQCTKMQCTERFTAAHKVAACVKVKHT